MHGNKEKAIRTVALAGNDETEILRLFEELTLCADLRIAEKRRKGIFLL